MAGQKREARLHAKCPGHPRFGRACYFRRIASNRHANGQEWCSGAAHRNCRIIGGARAHLPLEKVAGPMLTNELPMVEVLRLRALDGHRLSEP
jgi:hypothetical protein